MQTNTNRTQGKDGIAAQMLWDSAVLIREDRDPSRTAIIGAEIYRTINFITAETESEVCDHQEWTLMTTHWSPEIKCC